MKKTAEIILCVALACVFAFLLWNKLPVIYSNEGYARYQRGEYGAAVGYFEKAVARVPADLRSRSWLGACYEKLDRMAEAEAQYKAVVSRDPRRLEDYRALVRVLLAKNAFEEALTATDQALAANRASGEAAELRRYAVAQYSAFLVNTSFNEFASGARQEAYRRVRRLLAIDPGYAGHYILATFFVKDSNYAQACHELEEVARIKPDFAPALKLLGSLYFDQGMLDDAERAYKKALGIDLRDAVVYNDLGIIYMNQERYDDALPLLQRAVELQPDNAHMRYSLASIYRDNGRRGEAAEEYKRVIGLVPDYRNVHNELGALYEQEGLREDAEKEYSQEAFNSRQRLMADPGDPIALNDLAQALMGLGKFNEACACAQKAIELAPGYRQAYLNLASAEEKAGRLGNAKRALQAAQQFREADFINKDNRRVERLRLARDQEAAIRRRAGTVKVVLKNGRAIEGRLKSQDKETVEIDLMISGQGTLRLSRDSIERIDIP